MKIVIFTSCYHQADTLAESIESVLAQTHSDFEYWIYCDGCVGSSEIARIVESFDDPRIRFAIIPKAANVATIINRNWAESNPDIWVWCPSDDILAPDLLEKKLALHDRETVLYSGWRCFGDHEAELMPAETTQAEFVRRVWTREEWGKGPIMGFTGIWIPRRAYRLAGPFPEHESVSEDFQWLLQATARGVPFKCIREVLYAKRVHQNRKTARYDVQAGMDAIYQEVTRTHGHP